MVFQDREDAAHLLAEKLKDFRGQNALILGIPRGAIPMAKWIADKLQGELNAILVHKIPAPGFDELAIGAVGLSGQIFRLPLIEELGVSEAYLEKAAREQVRILKKRQNLFQVEEPDCRGRLVILVDDGIATGASMMGAIYEVKSQHPQRIIVAAPAVAKSTAEQIRPMVDQLVSLTEPEFFYAVSQFYINFSQVTDEEVIEILNQRRAKKKVVRNQKEYEKRL